VNARPAHHRFLERRITRDIKVPLSEDDLEVENGWRNIPIPPTGDDGWFILDDSSDRKTTWGRWHDVWGNA
jgi:hypothetical protein